MKKHIKKRLTGIILKMKYKNLQLHCTIIFNTKTIKNDKNDKNDMFLVESFHCQF